MSRRDRNLQIRLTAEELQALHDAADKDARRTAEWARLVLLAAADNDEPAPRPVD